MERTIVRCFFLQALDPDHRGYMLNQPDNFMQMLQITHADNPSGFLDILVATGTDIFNIDIHLPEQFGDMKDNSTVAASTEQFSRWTSRP